MYAVCVRGRLTAERMYHANVLSSNNYNIYIPIKIKGNIKYFVSLNLVGALSFSLAEILKLFGRYYIILTKRGKKSKQLIVF